MRWLDKEVNNLENKNEYYRDLILLARSGDEYSLTRLFEELKPMVNSVARRYFLNGGDQSDLVQEGMIGLYKALQNYDADSTQPFYPYAKKCVMSQVISAVRHSMTLKSSPLSEYASLSQFAIGDDEEDNEGIPSEDLTPDQTLELRERNAELSRQVRKVLSEFEWTVLKLFLAGYSYKFIANQLDKNQKSVDNAIVRIKNKLKFLEK